MSEEVKEAPAEQPAQVAQEARREVIEFVKLVFWFLVLFFALKTYVIEGYEVQGPSMEPALYDEQRILVFKLPHLLSRFSPFSGLEPIRPGDIIVFKSPDEPSKRYVKRVIAKGPPPRKGAAAAARKGEGGYPPGQTATVSIDRGEIYVNNRRIPPTKILGGSSWEHETCGEVVLGPGDYFVLGDNRAISKDSRNFGVVHSDQIIGKAVVRFWPLADSSLLE